MKGPGIRLDLDVRREWKCPQCGKQRRVMGNSVNVRCRCTREGTNMQLIETRRQTRSFADVIERVQQASTAKESNRQKKPETVDPPGDNQAAEIPEQHEDKQPTEAPNETAPTPPESDGSLEKQE